MIASTSPRPDPAGHYPFRVGGLQLVALSDGFIPTQDVRFMAPEVEPEELVGHLQRRGLSTKRLYTQVSCLLIGDLSSETVLIDGGIGRLPGAAGVPVATAGRLADNVRAAGVAADEIDVVLVSHLDPDHVGGLFDGDGRPTYPRARYLVAEDEARFWSQDAPDLSGQLGPPLVREHRARFAKDFLAYAGDRLETFAAGDAVLDGVVSVPVAGHTPHQVGFLLQSEDDELLYTADAFGNPLVSIERPHWRFTLDIDSPTAIATRRRLIAELQQTRRRFFTPHFPWPSLGRIGTLDGHPLWTPEPYAWTGAVEEVAIAG